MVLYNVRNFEIFQNMGLYDRDYTQQHYRQSGGMPPIRFGFSPITPAVKWLLIINIGVFMVMALSPGFAVTLVYWFAVDATTFAKALQLWRLVSYQFLHGSFTHILLNMLGVFFLGPTLERNWGSRKFVTFYLGCGVAGALFYYLLVGIGFLDGGKMVGASGAVLGMLAACAILFPHFVVILILFPLPIRTAAIILTIMYLALVVSRGENAGGEAAHLGGMAAGALYVLWQPWREKLKEKNRTVQWESDIARQRTLKMEVDRILKKVHESGIHSLTRQEKKTLEKATKTEQSRNRYN
jgi:membrane associated rhomboid family serine protease